MYDIDENERDMNMTNSKKTTTYSTKKGMPYTADELAKMSSHIYGLKNDESRSLIRLSAYMSQRMVPYRPICGEDISEAAARIMCAINNGIEVATRGLPSADKIGEKLTASQEREGVVFDNSTPEIYCEYCDTTNEIEPVDLYVCNICQYEFDAWSDYCPRCDRESRIEYCDYRCKKCNRYIPEAVC